MKSMRAVVAGFVLTLFPLAAAALPLAGQPAPDFHLPGPTAKDKAVSLAALRGHAVYLNFFATWCGPCNEEAPSIAQFRARYAKTGLKIVGVDELEAGSQGAAFESKFHAPYAVVAVDESGSVGKLYGVISMPVHVFINRRGVVTTYHIGEMSPAEIEAAIRGSLQ